MRSSIDSTPALAPATITCWRRQTRASTVKSRARSVVGFEPGARSHRKPEPFRMPNVRPSGRERDSISAPTRPPAPRTLSITIWAPSASSMNGSARREYVSNPPPGDQPTIHRTRAPSMQARPGTPVNTTPPTSAADRSSIWRRVMHSDIFRRLDRCAPDQRRLLASRSRVRLAAAHAKRMTLLPERARHVGARADLAQCRQNRVHHAVPVGDAHPRTDHERQAGLPVLIAFLELIVERRSAESRWQYFLQDVRHLAAQQRNALAHELAEAADAAQVCRQPQ